MSRKNKYELTKQYFPINETLAFSLRPVPTLVANIGKAEVKPLYVLPITGHSVRL